jgi:hypothetical protein
MRARLIGLGAVVLVVGAGTGNALASLFFIETAAIRITTPNSYVETTASVHGGLTGGQFKTERLQVALKESAQGTATGLARTAPPYATGYVVFHQSYCVSPPNYCPPPPAKRGYEVCRVNPAGGAWCYVLQSAVTCYCGERVPVRARGPGSTFNAPANSVTYVGWINPFVTVGNPAPITGGAEPLSSHVVKQSDLDAVHAALSSQVTAELRSALQQKAQGLHYIADAAPTLTVSTDVRAGAHTATFQVTVSGTLGATAFADADAKALIASALVERVPAGYQLNGPAQIADYQIQTSGLQGDVNVTGRATGYVMPTISLTSLQSRLRGLDPGAARSLIETAAPGSAIEIRLAPAPEPWLPLNADHITIVVVAAHRVLLR